MKLKDAVLTAKSYIVAIFADEDIVNVGLEEVMGNEDNGWSITIGFSRPWDRNNTSLGAVLGDKTSYNRVYKTVELDAFGEVRAVKNRDSQ